MSVIIVIIILVDRHTTALLDITGLNLLSEFNLDNLTVFSNTAPSADTVEVSDALMWLLSACHVRDS